MPTELETQQVSSTPVTPTAPTSVLLAKPLTSPLVEEGGQSPDTRQPLPRPDASLLRSLTGRTPTLAELRDTVPSSQFAQIDDQVVRAQRVLESLKLHRAGSLDEAQVRGALASEFGIKTTGVPLDQATKLYDIFKGDTQNRDDVLRMVAEHPEIIDVFKERQLAERDAYDATTVKPGVWDTIVGYLSHGIDTAISAVWAGQVAVAAADVKDAAALTGEDQAKVNAGADKAVADSLADIRKEWSKIERVYEEYDQTKLDEQGNPVQVPVRKNLPIEESVIASKVKRVWELNEASRDRAKADFALMAGEDPRDVQPLINNAMDRYLEWSPLVNDPKEVAADVAWEDVAQSLGSTPPGQYGLMAGLTIADALIARRAPGGAKLFRRFIAKPVTMGATGLNSIQSIYGNFLIHTDHMRPPDGMTVEEFTRLRRGAGLLAAASQTAIELGMLPEQAIEFGPLGRLVAKEADVDFFKRMISRGNTRAMLADLADKIMQSGKSNAKEEAYQQVIEYAITKALSWASATPEDASIGEMVGESVSAAKSGFVGGAGQSTMGAAVQYIHWNLGQQRATRQVGLIAAVANMDPEKLNSLRESPMLREALVRHVNKTQGEVIRHIYLDGTALGNALGKPEYGGEFGGTLDGFANALGLDRDTVAKQISSNGMVELTLDQYLTKVVGTNLGNALVYDTTTNQSVMTQRQAEEARRWIEQDFKARLEADGGMAAEWERVQLRLDEYEEQLRSLKLFHKRAIAASRKTIEVFIKTAVSRGFYHSPLELAMHFIPHVVPTLGKGVEDSEMTKLTEEAARGRAQADWFGELKSRGIATIAEDGRPTVSKDTVPTGATGRFVAALYHIPTGNMFMSARHHAQAFQENAARFEELGISDDDAMGLAEALLGDPSTIWEAGFVERETGRFVSRAEVEKITGQAQAMINSETINTKFEDIKFSFGAWYSRMKATAADRTVKDTSGRETKTKTPFSHIPYLGFTKGSTNIDLFHELGHHLMAAMHELSTLPGAPQDAKDAFAGLLRLAGWQSYDQYKEFEERAKVGYEYIRQMMFHLPERLKNLYYTEYTSDFIDRMENLDPEQIKELRSRWASDIDAAHTYFVREEKIAVMFENYVTSGKAPSVALSRAFIRLRVMFSRAIAGYQVTDRIKLTPAQRHAFDIILATDHEIARRNAFGRAVQVFRTPSEAGMNIKEWLEYTANLRMQLSPRVQQEEARYIKLLKEAYDREIRTAPDRDWQRIAENFEQSEYHTLAKVLYEYPVPLTREQAMDIFSEHLGGLALVESLERSGRLATAEAQAEAVANGAAHPMSLIDLGMVDRFTIELMLQGSYASVRERWARETAAIIVQGQLRGIAEEIKEASTNMTDLQILNDSENGFWLEMRAVHGRVPGIGLPPREAFKLAAAELVRTYRRKSVTKRAFQAMEQRAAESVLRFVAEKDWLNAARAYQDRMLYFYAAIEAAQMSQRFAGLDSLLRKAATAEVRRTVRRAHPDFGAALDLILNATGRRSEFVNVQQTYPELETVERYIEDSGSEVTWDRKRLEVTIAKLAELRAAGQHNRLLNELSVADGENIEAAVRQIQRHAAMYGEFLTEQGVKTRQEIIETARKETEKQRFGPGRWLDMAARKRLSRLNDTRAGLSAAVKHPMYILSRLGPTMFRFFYERFKDMKERDNLLSQIVLSKFLEFYEKMPQKQRDSLYELIPDADLDLPVNDREANLNTSRTRLWMLQLALNMGNTGNALDVLRGYGWTYEQVMDFLSKNMTNEEADFVESLWSFMDEHLYPHIREHYMATEGLDPGKVEALPLHLKLEGKARVLRGGYMPLRFRQDDLVTRQTRPAQHLRDVYKNANFGGVHINKGFTQARRWSPTIVDVARVGKLTPFEVLKQRYTDANGPRGLDAVLGPEEQAAELHPQVDLNWFTLPRHIAEVVHYVSYDRGVREMYAMTQDPEWRRLAHERLGVKDAEQVVEWLKDLAAGHDFGAHGPARAWTELFGAARGGLMTSVLGMSLSLPIGDTASLVMAVTSGRINRAYLAKVLMVNPWDVRAHAMENSQEVRLRSGAAHLEKLRRVVKQIGDQSKPLPPVQFMLDHAWVTFDAADKMLSAWLWEAAYQERVAAATDEQGNVSPESDERAKKEADRVIEEILPANDSLEKPAILRSKLGPWLMVLYWGFFSKAGDLSRLTTDPLLDQWSQAEGWAQKTKLGATAGVKTALALLGTWAAMQVLGELLSGRGPHEDEDPWLWAGRRVLTAPLLFMPVVGQALEASADRMAGRPFSPRSAGIAALVETLYTDMTRIASDQNDLNEKFWSALRLALTARGLPANQPTRTGEYVSGKTEFLPATTYYTDDWITGILYGNRTAGRSTVWNPQGEK